MKKILAVLFALVLCVNLCAVASAEEDWTIFVYICGSNLESDYSYASDNMQQMADAYTNSNVRYVVETGGAESWNNAASPNELDRFLITQGGSYLVDRQPVASMGDSNTLADFLRWGLQNYPASHVGLVLWDHGSGSINGVCFDDLADEDSLTLQDIDKALSSVKDLRPQGFDFVGFDACLMATVETAAMLAPHAK
ncbi:MAG: clostripain-related cysteine peptidase, partial [Candidatus Limivicinus sp.]